MTNLQITNNSDIEINENSLNSLCDIIISQEIIVNTLGTPLSIDLLITRGDAIKKLNSRFRGVDAKTDVLSFSGGYPDIPFLGDIIIDIEQADKQKGNMTLEYELQSLFIHGLLHLLGYDHISEQQKKIMLPKELHYRKLIKETKR